MALLFCDNFENWQTTNNNYPGPWLRTVGGTFGTGQSPNVNSNITGVFQTSNTGSSNNYLVLGIPVGATFILNTRVAFASTTAFGNRTLIVLFDDGTAQCSLVHKENGRLAIYRGTAAGTELAQSVDDFAVNHDVYLDIEWKVTIHNTTGVIELRVNGAEQIASTGSLNTRSTANNSANTIGVGSITTGTTRPYYKHFILMDTTGSTMNDFIGPVDVTSLRPVGDGEYTDFAANTGTRFGAVNQAVTDNDTTYVAAGQVGDKATFELANLPAGVTDVFAVFPQMQVKRDQGTTRLMKFLMRSGVDDEVGTKEFGIGPTYAFRQEAITESPFTTNAWDPAEVNSLELGVEITG